MTYPSDIAQLLPQLIARYESMPETPGPGEDHEAVVRRFELLSWLISWCYDHPDATLADYREVKRLALANGVTWPEVRVIADPACQGGQESARGAILPVGVSADEEQAIREHTPASGAVMRRNGVAA